MRNPLALAAIPASALLLASCAQPAQQGGGDGGGGDFSDITIGTGSTSGVYYPLGGALAEVISSEVEGTTASATSTEASVANMKQIGSEQLQMGIAQSDATSQAVNGERDFENTAVDAKVLTALYPNVYHAVSLESINEEQDFECFSDVDGERYSAGPAGSGNALANELIFNALELGFTSTDVQHLDYADTSTALRDGTIDAGSWVVGEGHNTLLELEATDPIHLIPFCDDERELITDSYPYYSDHVISGGTYSTVEDDVNTIALWNLLVVPSDFPEDKAYDVLDALYNNTDQLTSVYAAGEDYFVPETMAESSVTMHPGAVKWAEDNGVELPEEVLPEES
ncbi:TAXI family TRAP transporter solute-binding subunit [Nocardiopsis suaedae]|uniref:TAXI family TRAP transporter solute-binding subunit n=1 Tax=Nocardiopsis suaedae TaxID=3018444 RepID=A0ABT4TMJ1_9ACTN|nr:TAXI family TRAP transporter solute-binding subunit [Nocardiopsis suaedae]MDA2805831.1 TAXI family TRAP transporter solute-binding subunit [Nocardiopsis suaedae]